MIPETTTAGTPPNSEETALETVPETRKDIGVLNGEDAARYRKAVRRIMAKPNRKKVDDPWSPDVLASKILIAKIFTKEDVARVQLVDGMMIKQRLDAAIALGEAMVNGDEGGTLNPELRLKGIGIIAGAAKISGDLSEQITRLAEKAAVRAESGNGQKRKNLPPSTGIEMTVGEGENKVTTRVVATSGNEGA